MSKKTWILVGGALIAVLVVGGLAAQAVYAQTATPPTAPDGRGGPPGGPRLAGAELEAAAKALGMTTDNLSSQLQSGKTLAEIASAKGVDLQTVQSAIRAAHQQQMKTEIAQAVADGKMTQDKANWLLEGLNKGYLDGPGFGLGFGMGPGGPGGGRGPMSGATPQPQLQQ